MQVGGKEQVGGLGAAGVRVGGWSKESKKTELRDGGVCVYVSIKYVLR